MGSDAEQWMGVEFCLGCWLLVEVLCPLTFLFHRAIHNGIYIALCLHLLASISRVRCLYLSFRSVYKREIWTVVPLENR